MNIPNGIWAIIIGVTIFVVQTYFPGAEWAGPVVALLMAVAKIIHVNLPEPASTPRAAMTQESKVRRWLVG